jgi:Family of unknown function (DUF6069)
MAVPDDLTSREPDEHRSLATGRLWAGGVATGVVAALVVVAGVFIARRVLGIPVLAPRSVGNLGSSTTVIYAALAAACALLATGLLHVLLLATPSPLRFFGWIMALADVIAVAAPFAQPASLPSKVFTAVINLVAGVAVISLLSGVGSSALGPGGAASRGEQGHAD